MTSINLTFEITPKTTERARLSKWGVFTPPKTREYKKNIAAILKGYTMSSTDLGVKISELYFLPLALSVTFYIPPPKSLIRKNSDPWRNTLPTKKPDTDNLIKAFKDCLTGVLFNDDAQVTHEYVRKIYDVHPRIEMTLTISSVNLSSGEM